MAPNRDREGVHVHCTTYPRHREWRTFARVVRKSAPLDAERTTRFGMPEWARIRIMSVRRLSQLIEVLHATAYFSPEVGAAYAELGLRGFWRGYFAGRTSAVFLYEPDADAARITDLFGGFAPGMVARAIPEVWTITTPAAAYAARRDAAGAALATTITKYTTRTQKVLADLAKRIGDHLDDAPMAAAEAARPDPEDRGASAWHWATVLREFRGDMHLAAVREAGLNWPAMHVLVEPTGRLDPEQREFRGWSEEEWQAARDDLEAAGLYGTPAGAEIIEKIEFDTDARVAAALGNAPVLSLTGFLRPPATLVAAHLPFPNAMGLRPLDE